MSFINNILPTPASFLAGFLPSNSLANSRQFASGFTALITLSEQSTDNLTITDHPVEDGSKISDHAVMQPKVVRINFAYGANLGESLNDMYEKVLKLQSDKQPFDIVTGKRKYKNMLIESISNTTDSNSENCLNLEISCREVIIVYSEIKEVEASAQKESATTASPANTGTKSVSKS